MAEASILFEGPPGGGRLTPNPPHVLNSFNGAMALSLQRVLADVARDDGLRAVYLTGAGRAFCAGQDLAEAAPPEGPGIVDFGAHVRDYYNPLVLALRRMPKT